MSTIILINESRRLHHFPAVVVPEDRDKLDPAGKARDAKNLPVDVRRQKFGPLDVGARLEVPEWYFRELMKIRQLAAIFQLKTGGIAVGRSSTEKATDERRAREIALELVARDANARAEQANAEVAKLRSDLDALMAELAKQSKKSEPKPEAKPEPKPEPKPTDTTVDAPGPRSSRNG